MVEKDRAVSRWFGDLSRGRHFGDLRIVAAFSGFVIFLGLAVTINATPLGARTANVLWSIALLTASGLLGFLFAIPRVLQGTGKSGTGGITTTGLDVSGAGHPARKPSDEIAYQQRVNTNLEEISDWLTKMIVGVGLIELHQLPALIRKLAIRIATSSDISGNVGLASAIQLPGHPTLCAGCTRTGGSCGARQRRTADRVNPLNPGVPSGGS